VDAAAGRWFVSVARRVTTMKSTERITSCQRYQVRMSANASEAYYEEHLAVRR